MAFDDVIQLILDFLAVVGGIGVIVVALVTWYMGVWRDLINIRATTQSSMRLEEHKKKLTEELEELKNEFVKQQKYVDRSLSVFSTIMPASHQRVLSAVDSLWKAVIQIRELTQVTLSAYHLLTKEEVESTVEHAQKFVNISEDELFKGLDINVTEQERPFLGENLWMLFFVYQAFCRRLSFKLIRGKEQGRFYYWDKGLDGKKDNFFSIFNLILSEEETKRIKEVPEYQVVIMAQRTIELKIITEMNRLIFGHTFVDLSFEEQKRILELSQEIAIDTGNQFNS